MNSDRHVKKSLASKVSEENTQHKSKNESNSKRSRHRFWA